jgi:drug/metabolite transporter (DMT)-like permease
LYLAHRAIERPTPSMQLKAAISFAKRGLTGLLLIAAGITLAIIFNKRSAYSADIKQDMYLLASLLAVGGTSLFGSYVKQRSFQDMKQELFATGFMMVTLVLLSLTNN